ncbi:MAG: TonB-dependent siderophore receptor [Betaproteobacteria bacterium]|nr:TonB-dependent siderophore receptor [Betaproteobacteria bacterium]
MACTPHRLCLAPVAAACALLAAASAWSQTATLPQVTVSERVAPVQADISGLNVPLREAPLSASVISADDIAQRGARRLADLTAFDSSVTDAYNAGGYIDYLTVRGFVIDNRFNYRREGLPISAETSIALENKERVEVLRGTSGLQAGTSAPGGLVNYVVKRPVERDVRDVRIEYTARASMLAAADLGSRFGADRAFGWRLNIAAEQLRPLVRALDGERHLVALATDWRIDADRKLQAEIESSHRSQPTQAGFSLLGNTLPTPVNPRLNLNNQPWSRPTVFDGVTGSLRYESRINDRWKWSAQAGSQQLRTDDRIAFPYGCSAEDRYDRYCRDGSFDLYDFRSDNERRRVDAASVSVQGRVNAGGVTNDIGATLLHSQSRQRFGLQAYNYVGTGNVQGTAVTSPDPTTLDQNTNRDERSLELSLHDAIRWNPRWTTWVGLRASRIERASVRTNGSRPTDYADTLVTPWLAVSHRLSTRMLAYASWGEGVESQVVPNRPSQYTNAGAVLPALKSRQWELGLRGGDALASGSGLRAGVDWQISYFDIKRPVSNLDACSRLGIAPCLGTYDGLAQHRGLEARAQWVEGPWRAGASATLLDAKRRDSSAEPEVNGKAPTNVPAQVVRTHAAWRLPALPGAELQGAWQFEGRRAVLPDGSLTLPAWHRVDAALHYDTRMGAQSVRWTVGIDNLLDRRFWRESPYQFGHVYLYPGAVRTLRVGLTASL